MVHTFKVRLQPHFEVKWITDIFMEWEEIKDETAILGKRDKLTSWIIEDVSERARRLERDELKAMPKVVGCTLAQLMEAYREVSAATKRGLPNEDRKLDRMSKLLKERGHPKAMPTIVHRWVALLRKHNPELFPKPERKQPLPPRSNENVVPFKR